MKTALFTNFTNEEFIGYWDGKGKKFAPGESTYMPDYLARHFAKHLTNRELLRKDKNGNLIYKDGEKMTSPKRPEDVPLFMEIFSKAYTPEKEEELGSVNDDIDALIGSANKNREEDQTPTAEEVKPAKGAKGAKPKKGEKQDPTKPQVIVPADFDEDEDDESAFTGKPKE